ncbi:MAG TPA: hypothetical protein VF435_15645 [Pyrinomonadaceae bacterium]
MGVFLTRAIVQLYREPSAWQVLLSFENQDLEGLDEKSSAVLQTAITAVTGHASKNQFHEFFPRIFRTISNTNGEKRYILVEEEPLMTIPGNSWLRVHVFDTAGNLLNEQEFNAGNRVFLTSIQVRRIQMISSDVLIGQGQFDFGGHSLTQYYVLSENQMALVYLELDGLPDTNRYATIGPEIQRSVDEWEKALHSDNDAEVLVALLWLGRHDSNEEPAISIVSSREQVRKRLFELSQSENLWVKAAAQPIISKMMLAAPSQ